MIYCIHMTDVQDTSFANQASANVRKRQEEEKHDIHVAGGVEALDPKVILAKYNMVKPGDTIIDLGCGNMPYFSLQAARMAGQEGKLYLVDVQKSVLSAAESHVKMSGFKNVISVWSDLETIGATDIPAGTGNIAFIVNVLFQSKRQKEILDEAARLLIPGGKLLVIDYKPNSAVFAPKDHVSKDHIIDSGKQVGLVLEHDFEAGSKHWGLIFAKK